MRNELEQLEWIDRYLQNRLAAEDVVDFERQMNTDAVLKETVNEQRLIHEMVIDRGLIDVKKKLQQIDARNHPSNGNLKKWGGAGLATILIIVTTTFFYNKKKEPETVVTPYQTAEIPKQEAPLTTLSQTVKKEKLLKRSEAGPLLVTTDSSVADLNEKALIPAIPLAVDSTEYIPTVTVTEVITENVQPACGLENSILISTTENSCADSPTGKIFIDHASQFNGKPPFSFSVNGRDYVTSYQLAQLYDGSYLITVEDADGCTWTSPQEVVIYATDCKPLEFSFYPARGEVWKFPLGDNTSGKLEIYNATGTLVWTSTITNGYPDQWDGTSNGQVLPMGSYSFIFRPRSGSAISGSVTMLR